ncbi:ribosomal protein S12 methylthiotransferase RimO [Peptococcaceae bacterium CEB3]|nr:ribosomal protein S12 methylthiotransferase RimO [Peptococcaceae bacterium CEB3]
MKGMGEAKEEKTALRERTLFLPMNRQDMRRRGWEELDFLLISGDAYVDHPSFGAAIISRCLEKKGYRVGVLAQPDWRDLEVFRGMGRPRLACLITGGNLDSLVNHYTAAKKRRSNDAYSPGGASGRRPDRATIVYSNRVREALPGVPVIIGGIEASLRRFAHYDYWSDKVRRSILLDSQADLLVYGMGERAILEIARELSSGKEIGELLDLRGTVVLERTLDWAGPERGDRLILPSFEDIFASKRRYAESFMEQYQQQDPVRGKTLVEFYRQDRKVVRQNPPQEPLSQSEMDEIYALPYTGTYHPQYGREGVPALQEVEFSLVSARGCYGSCSFCALTFHQGRIVQSRSAQSIVREAKRLTASPRFKGYIHDVGGPTANFRRPACPGQLKRGACAQRQCLYPSPCDRIDLDHGEYLELLRALRSLPGVKKVFVRSGIRYDAVLADKNTPFLRELCQYHVSGQLKVAPEHVSPSVLKRMGKPGPEVYAEFVREFKQVNEDLGKKQYLVPYLMSSHPGSGLKEAVELAEFVRDLGVNPEQVQDFIPTPGTLSTCMYYTGLDPRTMEKVYVPKGVREKARQRALIQYRNPANYSLVEEALRLAGREDLIGYGKKCLIKPRNSEHGKHGKNGESGKSGQSGKRGKQRAANRGGRHPLTGPNSSRRASSTSSRASKASSFK